MSDIRELETPHGPGRLHVDRAPHERARLLLGHGAGGGVEAHDLVALAEAGPAMGVTVVRFEQPWRVAGKKVAGRGPTLDLAVQAAIDALPAARTPLVLAGRSAGARVACRVAAERRHVGLQPAVAGVVCLAFPLRPPWRPEASRADELAAVAAAGLPLHVVQGSRDVFGSAEDVRAVPSLRCDVVHEVPLADHSFIVPKRAGAAAGTSTERALAQVVRAVADALRDMLAGAAAE